MTERCGNCGALNPASAETCEACGALLAAYRSPAGATGVMPEPDVTTATPPVPESPPAVPTQPVTIPLKDDTEDEVAPESITWSAPVDHALEQVADHVPGQPSEIETQAAPTAPALAPGPPSTRPEMIRPDPAPVGSLRPPAIRPDTSQRQPPPRIQSAPEAPRPTAPEATPQRPAFGAGSVPSNRLVAGGIVLVLVSCVMFGVGASPGVTDLVSYLALCLGPLGIISLVIGAGLAKLKRPDSRR